MLRFILRVIIVGAAALGVAQFSGGTLLQVDSVLWAIVFAVALGFVNAVIKPIVQLIALPLSILTVGIFAAFVNLGMFYLAAALVPGVRTVGFWPSVGASIIIAFFSGIASWLTEQGDNA